MASKTRTGINGYAHGLLSPTINLWVLMWNVNLASQWLVILYHFVQLVTVVTRDRLDEILVSSNYHIRKFWWWFVRKFAIFGPFSEVFWCVTAWQALLLVNSEVRVTRDWLIERNGTVYDLVIQVIIFYLNHNTYDASYRLLATHMTLQGSSDFSDVVKRRFLEAIDPKFDESQLVYFVRFSKGRL